MFVYLFIYLFLAVLGLCFCVRAFSSFGKWAPLFIAVRGPLTIAAFFLLQSTGSRRAGSVVVAHGPSCSAACGMRDPPRPGLEPVSPALAGRFSTTAPPGKPQNTCFYVSTFISKLEESKNTEHKTRKPGFEAQFSIY